MRGCTECAQYGCIYEASWAKPDCCLCFPVELGLRLLVWLTCIGFPFQVLWLLWILFKQSYPDSPYPAGALIALKVTYTLMVAMNIVAIVHWCKFMKNDTPETRKSLVRGFIFGFVGNALGGVCSIIESIYYISLVGTIIGSRSRVQTIIMTVINLLLYVYYIKKAREFAERPK